ncbi:MAG: bifunctional phosphoribosylaminoimidazolecarboxamide formyltransferase/IMP cyclohydrolase [Alphaproteobacteria bacterium]|nr:bifunctional phosphoribosylaminoimidazolecarboxamide formyltransferase/IMP cyclohydrolase [Alphaproteobacteria bacterium]
MSGQVLPVSRALLSVSDKTGIAEFAGSLAAAGVELVATGGTYKILYDACLAVRELSDLTGFPEILGGRVKTLHPRIHGGLLYQRGKSEDEVVCREHGIVPIDLLIVTLYPFERLCEEEHSADVMIDNIDIGGPAMIRSAAKNHASVAVIVDPLDYDLVLKECKEYGGILFETRRWLAGKAYARTAAYDAVIASWFSGNQEVSVPSVFLFPRSSLPLRYGENPHQKACLYRTSETRPGVAGAVQVQGRQLSYNNINDTDAAFEAISEFSPCQSAAVAIFKHANPCGVAVASSLEAAYVRARACDPMSAFGSIVACNMSLDGGVARAISGFFTEVIIAPDADEEARSILAEIPALRLLLTGSLPDPRASGHVLRSVAGGLLLQSRDGGVIEDLDVRSMTSRTPTEAEWSDLYFAFRVVKHVRSNAIVYARDGATVGIGAGQMSRIDSAILGVRKAEDAARLGAVPDRLTAGAVAASDAFFSFVDGLRAITDAGVTAIIQPGGSKRDEEVIAAAEEAGVSLILTGMRNFRH